MVSNHSKKFFIVLFILGSGIFIFMFLHRLVKLEPRDLPSASSPSSLPSSSQLSSSIPSRNPSDTSNGNFSTEEGGLDRESFKKTKNDVAIYDLPRAPLGKSKYLLVKGLHASSKKFDQMKLVSFVNGIYYYDNPAEQMPENAVFDQNVETIGFWTGQILIEGSDKRNDEIQSKFDLEWIQEEAGRAIFQAGSRFSLLRDYPALISWTEPAEVRLNLSFSRAMRQ